MKEFEESKKEEGIYTKYKLGVIREIENLRNSGFVASDPKHRKITKPEQLILQEDSFPKDSDGFAAFKKGDQFLIFYYHNKNEKEMKKMIDKLKTL